MAEQKTSVPLMHAFRAAFEAHDAKVRADLRDDAGERVIAARRSRARGAIGELTLRREVARDLESLLNTVSLASSLDLSDAPEVARSILNFGLPDLVHLSIDDQRVDGIGKDLAEALRTFEPRLAPDSVSVTRDSSASVAGLALRFMVRADLVSDPVNVPLEFVADVELDSGKIRVGPL